MKAQRTPRTHMGINAFTGVREVACVTKARVVSREGIKGAPQTEFSSAGFH